MAEESVLESAIILHAAGYSVILTDHMKNPGFVGGEWHKYKWNAKKFASWLQTRPNLQLGLKLWPIVDVEIDAPEGDDGAFVVEATRELQSLAGYIETPSWVSRRGRHWLFKVSDAQRAELEALQCSAVVKLGKLEIRLGCGKAAQSLIPPSTTDGFQRKWVSSLDMVPIMQMPDAMFRAVKDAAQAALDKRRQAEAQADDELELLRPGDVFNERASWDDILTPHGWAPIHGPEHEIRHWIRPGKREGISGTTGFCKSTLRNDCFYSFSTSPDIAPLEAQRSYSKFEAITTLEFDGDFSVASAELARQGYAPELSDGSEFEALPPEDEDETIPSPATRPDMTRGVTEGSGKPPRPPKGVVAAELSEFVYDNPIGRYVLANDPHTEADRDSVLLQSWEIFGNFIGKEAQFRLNNSTIYQNGYLAIVGKTALGRKGTALQDAFAPYRFDEPELDGYMRNRVRSGISSGEGIIALVADNPTFTDGRLLVTIQEFHRLMTVLKRTDSTLSSVMREAYDGGMLSVATRINPLVATQAHVSMVVHTTADEFIETVDNIDIFNGVLNRVLFFVASDGKTLPNPGRVDPEYVEQLSKHIVACRDWAANNDQGRQFYWSEDAAGRWADYYVGLRRPTGDSHIDAILARGNTHVIKLAMRHAALDMSEAIQIKHLESAIAIWEKCKECAAALMTKQNPLTDDRQRLLDAIRDSAGMTKTECMKIFNNNRKASEIEDGLDYLRAQNMIALKRMKRNNRSVQVWVAN